MKYIEDKNTESKVFSKEKSNLYDIVGIVSREKSIDSVKIQKKLDFNKDYKL